MNSQEIEKTNETNAAAAKKPETAAAELDIISRTALTLIGCIVSFLIVATHFLFSVRTAHFFGDVSYIPPSILHYTGFLFQAGEVEAGAQILFFIVWAIFVLVGIVAASLIFLAAAEMPIGLLTDEPEIKKAAADCIENGFLCLLPVAILSVLTLLIMPLESYHMASDSASLTQLGEMMPFAHFLFTMDAATLIIFIVCIFVVSTVGVSFLLSWAIPFLDDGGFFFFCTMFVGVCVSIALTFVLGHYGYAGLELLKAKINNPYLTHYAIFGIYSAACGALLLPSMLGTKKKKADTEKLNEALERNRRKQAKRKKQPAANVIPDINF